MALNIKCNSKFKKEEIYYRLIMRLDNNSDDHKTLELVSSLRKYFFFFVLGYSSFVIPLTIFMLIFDVILAFVGLIMPWLIFGILLYGLYASWSIRAKILITSISLEIFVNRSPFLELRWDEIERIIILKEEREIPIARYRIKDTAIGYSLRAQGIKLDKTIHLWCLGFGLRNQKKIISFMMNLCKGTNIQISIEDSPKSIIERHETPCDRITKFRKALDDEKKKRQGERIVNGGHFW